MTQARSWKRNEKNMKRNNIHRLTHFDETMALNHLRHTNNNNSVFGHRVTRKKLICDRFGSNEIITPISPAANIISSLKYISPFGVARCWNNPIIGHTFIQHTCVLELWIRANDIRFLFLSGRIVFVLPIHWISIDWFLLLLLLCSACVCCCC